MNFDENTKALIVELLGSAIAFQLPWGEWASVAHDQQRAEMINRDVSTLMLKPNGFRTLLALETLYSWIDDRDRTLAKAAVSWFKSCLRDGWFQLYRVSDKTDHSSIYEQRQSREINAVADLRHTSQALECFLTYSPSSFDTTCLDTLKQILKMQKENGSWSQTSEKGKEELVYSTMSCLSLVEKILQSDSLMADIGKWNHALVSDLEVSRMGAVNFFSKNLFVDEAMKMMIPISVCIDRLHPIFEDRAPFLLEKARVYFRNRWHYGEGRWLGEASNDNPLDINALSYSAFSKIAELDKESDVNILNVAASYLNNNLEQVTDITTTLFMLMGHRRMIEWERTRIPKLQLEEIVSTEIYEVTRYNVYLYDLTKRVIILFNFFKMHDPSENCNRVYKNELDKTADLISALITMDTSKDVSELLRKLRIELQASNWGEVVKRIPELINKLEPASDGSTTGRVKDLKWLKEFAIDFSARVTAYLLK